MEAAVFMRCRRIDSSRSGWCVLVYVGVGGGGGGGAAAAAVAAAVVVIVVVVAAAAAVGGGGGGCGGVVASVALVRVVSAASAATFQFWFIFSFPDPGCCCTCAAPPDGRSLARSPLPGEGVPQRGQCAVPYIRSRSLHSARHAPIHKYWLYWHDTI